MFPCFIDQVVDLILSFIDQVPSESDCAEEHEGEYNQAWDISDLPFFLGPRFKLRSLLVEPSSVLFKVYSHFRDLCE